MDRSDQPPNAEESDPKQEDAALTEESAKHLARRRLLQAAVATAGAVGATAAASGGSNVFAKSLLYSLNPMGGGGPTATPSVPKPTATKTNPTATATTTLPQVTCKTCTLNTQPPFTPQDSFQNSESLFVSFTVHNLPAGSYTLDLTSDTGPDHEFTTTSTPFKLQSAMNAASVQQFPAGTASDCATQEGSTKGNTVADVADVTVTGSSNADVQLVVHLQLNNPNGGTFTFTGTIKQSDNAVCSSQATATFASVPK